jgi:hypothetical protein
MGNIGTNLKKNITKCFGLDGFVSGMDVVDSAPAFGLLKMRGIT